MVLLAAVVGLVLWLVMWLSGNGGAWTARHRCALAAGALWFFAVLLMFNEPGIVMLLMAALLSLILWLVLRACGQRRSWAGRNSYALAGGLVWLAVFLLRPGDDADLRAKALVGLAGLVFLVAAARQAQKVAVTASEGI